MDFFEIFIKIFKFSSFYCFLMFFLYFFQDDNNFQVISQHNVIENRSQEDEDMNSAAIKIQTHYKKKKYNQKMKQKKSNNLDSSETLT